MLIQAKQISKFLYAPVRVSGFAASATTSDAASVAITAALSTASDAGTAVPVVSATATAMGIVTAGNNRVEIYDSATQEKIAINGNEVYARVDAAFNLNYFTVIGGVETATALDKVYTLDFEFPYQFDFVSYPREAAIAIKARNVSDDPKAAAKPFYEKVAVTAQNVLANLSFTPVDLTQVKLSVNGQVLYANDHFTVAGNVVTLLPAVIGYNVDTTDLVFVEYLKY